MEINLVRKIAWSFHRTTGIEFDDLFSEACIAYLQAEEQFIANGKGKKTTFLYQAMRNHLSWKYGTNKSVQEIQPDDFFEPSYPRTPLDDVEFKDQIEHLPKEARTICSMILSSPDEYTELAINEVRGVLRQQLREKGWTWSQIWKGFREVKMFLNSTA